MRLWLIIPHKTKVAIALWRRNTKEFKAPPCVSIGGFFIPPAHSPLIPFHSSSLPQPVRERLFSFFQLSVYKHHYLYESSDDLEKGQF